MRDQDEKGVLTLVVEQPDLVCVKTTGSFSAHDFDRAVSEAGPSFPRPTGSATIAELFVGSALFRQSKRKLRGGMLSSQGVWQRLGHGIRHAGTQQVDGCSPLAPCTSRLAYYFDLRARTVQRGSNRDARVGKFDQWHLCGSPVRHASLLLARLDCETA
jgi:hypothetical protein